MGHGKLVLRAGHGSPVLSLERQSVQATAQMMREINALSREELGPEDVIVHGFEFMNTAPMHESSWFVRRFDDQAVREAQALVRGKPVLCNHDTESHGALPVGRIFRADGVVVNAEGITTGRALFYLLNDAEGQSLDRKIRSGLISEVSPTVTFNRIYCSICGADDLRCDHVPGDYYAGSRCFTMMTEITD